MITVPTEVGRKMADIWGRSGQYGLYLDPRGLGGRYRIRGVPMIYGI